MAGSDFCIMAPVDYGAGEIGARVSGVLSSVDINIGSAYPWPALMSDHLDWAEAGASDIVPAMTQLISQINADLGDELLAVEYKWFGRTHTLGAVGGASWLNLPLVVGWQWRIVAGPDWTSESVSLPAVVGGLDKTTFGFPDPYDSEEEELPGSSNTGVIGLQNTFSQPGWWSTLQRFGWALEPIDQVARRQAISPYSPASGITTITFGERKRYEFTAQWCPAARAFSDRLAGWPASGWAAQASRLLRSDGPSYEGPDKHAVWDEFWRDAARGGTLVFSSTDPDAEPRLMVLTGGSDLAQTYDRTVPSGRWYDITCELDLVGSLSDLLS